LNTEYFVETTSTKESLQDAIKDKLPGWNPDGPEYKNIQWKHSNTAGDIPGIMQRLALHDQEAETLAAKSFAPVQVERCLGPGEEILARLGCVGFDGFPDWGMSERQQRLGECLIVIIGSSDIESCVPTRIIMSHVGKLRSISATELDAMCCGKKAESGMWDVQREQTTGLAVLSTKTQLVTISAEQLDRLSVSKGHGMQNRCFAWIYVLLPFLVCIVPLVVIGAIMSLAVIIPALLFMLIAALCIGCVKATCVGKSTSFYTDAVSDPELKSLITKEDHYKASSQSASIFAASTSDEKWTATLFQSSYHAVSMCVADPVSDSVREVIAIIKPEVSQDDIAKFVLFADRCKMDRSSSKSTTLKFGGGNRALRRAAKANSVNGAAVAFASGPSPALYKKLKMAALCPPFWMCGSPLIFFCAWIWKKLSQDGADA
jgi:hypothetical protein